MYTKPDPRHPRPGTRTALAALVAGALLLGACGDDDTADAAEESTTTTTTTAAETTTTTTTAAENDETASAPAGAEALVGMWESPTARETTFDDEGAFTVTEGGDVLAEGTYTATPTTIELVPGSGAIACDQPATYEWKIEDDTLTLTVVSDECTGRKEGLDGVPRERVE